MYLNWFFVFAVIWQANGQNETEDLWSPDDGRPRAEWLQHHGQSATTLQRVKQKLFELKINEIAADAPEYDIDEETLIELFDQDRLDSCLWLTEEQLNYMLEGQKQEKNDDQPESMSTAELSRKKRKIIDFKKRPQRMWTSMPIRYKFDGKHSHSERQIIRGAFHHWMEQTCVEFEEVSVNKKLTENHILVTRESTGCHSFPGQVDIIPQQLNLQHSCLNGLGTSVHEIGHALGLWHEQQRADRDDHIRILWQNVIQGYVGQFYKNTRSVDLGVPYDLGSVMHYPSKAGSKNKQNTMESRDPEYQGNIGQRTGLSFFDAKIINLAYCSDKCDPNDLRQQCQREGYQDPNNCRRCLCPDGFSGPYCERLAQSRNADCGGEVKVGDTAVTVQSPGYQRPGYYDNFQFCVWHFKVKHNGDNLLFRFEDDFGIYCHNQQVCYHWAELRYKNSLGQQGPRFCCYNKPSKTFRSQLGEMVLIFKANFSISSDWTSSRRGFKATVTAVPRQVGPPGRVTTTTTVAMETEKPGSEEEDEETGTTKGCSDFEWRCSFEGKDGEPTWCDITQDKKDDFDWTMQKDNTPSGNTGPDYAYSGKYYVFIEATQTRKEDYAIFYLPDMHRTGRHCIRFRYHMHGFHIHKLLLLKISRSGSEKVVWQKAKQQGDRWLKAGEDFYLEDRDQLAFKGVVDGEYSGDIAVDSLYIHSGNCDSLSGDDPLLDVDVTTVARGATAKTTWFITWLALIGTKLTSVLLQSCYPHVILIG